MDSAEFLDLLGNANRRRILQLLARKPCYVTEISEFLGVSPKAVIDHLRKLEDAGLVESRTDDRRRKYFSIARHIRLEVTVSPYEFGTKSAYPANSRLDLTSCRRISIELNDTEIELEESAESARVTDADSDEKSDTDSAGAVAETQGKPAPEVADPEKVTTVVRQLRDFKQLENELSLAQRWTQGRITGLRDQLARTVGNGDPRLIIEILLELVEDASQVEELSRTVDVPPQIVEDVLEDLAAEGIVYRDGHRWHLDE